MWGLSRFAHRLSGQRQLRYGAFCKAATAQLDSSARALSAQTLLQSRRGRLTPGGTRAVLSQTTRNRLTAGDTTLQTFNAAVPAAVIRSAKPLTRMADKTVYPRASRRHFGFLPKTFAKNKKQPYGSRYLEAKATLKQEQRRYQELQFYRRQPKLSLPDTVITRQRKRRSGKVVFTRNLLRQPITSGGQQKMLLPPVKAYTASTKVYVTGQPLSPTALALSEQREDTHPVF